jgi:hypothetical protein
MTPTDRPTFRATVLLDRDGEESVLILDLHAESLGDAVDEVCLRVRGVMQKLVIERLDDRPSPPEATAPPAGAGQHASSGPPPLGEYGKKASASPRGSNRE